MFAVNVKGSLSLAAPSMILFGGSFSFTFSFISGMPLSANTKESSLVTSNLAIFSGINCSKLRTSDRDSNNCDAGLSTMTFWLSKFMVVFWWFRHPIPQDWRSRLQEPVVHLQLCISVRRQLRAGFDSCSG